MKVALILPSLSNVGPCVVMHSLISVLYPKYVDFNVYYFDEKFGLDFPCPAYNINKVSLDYDKYDIIHSNMYRPDSYVYKDRNKIHKAKLVTTMHQDISQNLQSTYNRLVSKVFTPIWLRRIACFDAVVPISNSIKELYKKRLNNLSYTIYNGVNVNYNPSNADSKIVDKIKDFRTNGLITIGTYAYLTFRKGIDQLIALLRYRDDVCLIVIGDGDAKQQLVDLSVDYHVNDRILFLPYVKDPYNYLKYVDIYAMPSRSEGFGLAIVEAAYTRTPIVCSDIDVFHEIFSSEQVSFFKINDVQSLSLAIDNAILKGKYLADMAYDQAVNCFSKNVMAQKYLDLYKSLLKW